MVKMNLSVLLLCLSMGAVAQTLDGVMLRFMISEPGLEPYPSRMIITEKMIRMDDGSAQGDYLLFDRERQQISSVTHEDETVLDVPLRPLPTRSPIALERHHTLEADAEAPSIDGKQPQRLRLFVNEKLCHESVVVPGLLPDVANAISDFRRVLAGEQGKILDDLPVETLDACDLALNTFYPAWPLHSGLAVQEFDVTTRSGRLLLDIEQTFKADEKLFVLPSGYRHYQTQ